MTIPQDALKNETTLKQFLPSLKQIEQWNKNFVHELLLLDGGLKFELASLCQALMYEAHQFFLIV